MVGEKIETQGKIQLFSLRGKNSDKNEICFKDNYNEKELSSRKGKD